MTRPIYAVIGNPVAHSLSPVMHNAAFRALKLDAEYIPIHVPDEDLEAFAEKAKQTLCGFNITVPHKKAIIPCLDEVEENARIAGSVNTVTIREGKLSGCSTDGYGLQAALAEAFSFQVKGSDLLFTGCGGAARAVAFHFARLGLRKLYILNRTPETAQTLLDEIRQHYPAMEGEAGALSDLECCKTFLEKVPVLVQCTSLGLREEDPSPVPLEFLKKDLQVFDTIYKPTALLRYCKEHKIQYGTGLGMLLHQGARSFSIWTGKEAPLEVMRNALPPVPGL